MKIGAPSTNAAKKRCNCATSHTAVRAPISGKSRGMSLPGELRGHDQRAVHAALVVIGKGTADLVLAFLQSDFEANGAARAELFGGGVDPRPLDVKVVREAPFVAQHERDFPRRDLDLARFELVFLEPDRHRPAAGLDEAAASSGFLGCRLRRTGPAAPARLAPA